MGKTLEDMSWRIIQGISGGVSEDKIAGGSEEIREKMWRVEKVITWKIRRKLLFLIELRITKGTFGRNAEKIASGTSTEVSNEIASATSRGHLIKIIIFEEHEEIVMAIPWHVSKKVANRIDVFLY